MIIKGNASEIKALTGANSKNSGVDNADSIEDAIEAAKLLLEDYKNIKSVIITGREDFLFKK